MSDLSRREFLALGLGWFPFFWRRRPYETLGGVRFQVMGGRKSPRRFLLIHGNEETARAVLTGHMRSHPGTAYLVAGHDRYVTIEGAKLDPNRMFSAVGAEASLRRLNPDLPPERIEKALRKIDKGRAKLLSRILPAPGSRIVALHNNSEGYSVEDEVPISDETALHDRANPHQFFLCTDPADFATLATSPYNVVFQRRAPKVDDGSLSRLAARLGVRYVNLEVARGNAAKQVEMLAWLEKHLR